MLLGTTHLAVTTTSMSPALTIASLCSALTIASLFSSAKQFPCCTHALIKLTADNTLAYAT